MTFSYGEHISWIRVISFSKNYFWSMIPSRFHRKWQNTIFLSIVKHPTGTEIANLFTQNLYWWWKTHYLEHKSVDIDENIGHLYISMYYTRWVDEVDGTQQLKTKKPNVFQFKYSVFHYTLQIYSKFNKTKTIFLKI